MADESKTATSDLIKALSLAIGVTGYSGAKTVHQTIKDMLTPYVDRVEQDRIGSIVGVKAGQQSGPEPERRKLMVAAHLDEIGAIVTKIENGFLRFAQIGGLDDRVLMGQEVMVHSQRDLPGIIGSTPPHLLPASRQKNGVDQAHMHIDVGLPPRQVKQLVQVGDIISFTRSPETLQNGLLSGKAMDNRASVATMLLCLQTLSRMEHDWDVYAVATADEEWGSYVGATTQAYAIRPEAAIVMDVTFADVEDSEVKLGSGPVISQGPSNHPAIRRRLLDICQKLELKHQSELMTSGRGTDAYAVEISREGIPTILLSIPSRYMHSPIEVVDPKDIERTARLLAHFVASLDEAFVTELTPAD